MCITQEPQGDIALALDFVFLKMEKSLIYYCYKTNSYDNLKEELVLKIKLFSVKHHVEPLLPFVSCLNATDCSKIRSNIY